jgi:hypothetical protein
MNVAKLNLELRNSGTELLSCFPEFQIQAFLAVLVILL